MNTMLIVVVAAGVWLAADAEAAPFASCSSESFTIGGLARGEGEGVWVPSDFRVAFNCAALAEGTPDPTPIYALFNTLFGFESSFPLPPGRFEVDTKRSRPLYLFVPEHPEGFGTWWQTQVRGSAKGGVPKPSIASQPAGGMSAIGR